MPVRSQTQCVAIEHLTGRRLVVVLDLLDATEIERGIEVWVFVVDRLIGERQRNWNALHAFDEIGTRDQPRRASSPGHLFFEQIRGTHAHEDPDQRCKNGKPYDRDHSEETGLQADIVKALDTIEYFFRAGDTLIRKRVDFYLMTHTGGELKPQLSEVDDVEWVELSEAIRRASFASEKKLLESAQQELEPSQASS